MEISCREWADDHTYLQDLCRKAGFTEQEVIAFAELARRKPSEALAQLRAELAEVIHDEVGENSCEVVFIKSRFSELHGQIDDLRRALDSAKETTL